LTVARLWWYKTTKLLWRHSCFWKGKVKKGISSAGRRVFYRIQNVPFYAVVLALLYLAVIYAPLMYKGIMFKAYIKDVISYPGRYTPVMMRSLILAESEKYGFSVDSLYIEPKRDEIYARAKWHTEVDHVIDALDHRMNFSIDTSVKFYKE